MGKSQYDISETSYSKFMSDKKRLYNGLVVHAQQINYDNNGKPTKKEADCYNEAATVCAEIINKNMGQSAVSAQWKSRKEECEAEVRRIVDALSPVPVVPQGAETSGFSTYDVFSNDQPSYSSSAARPAARPASAARPAAAPAAAKRPANGAKPDENGVTTTESGFSTKNATKEVPAETIEKWFQNPPKHDFSAVTGMTDVKERLGNIADQIEFKAIREQLGMSPVQSILFYGPPGCGKTFIIEAFANELMKKGFHFLRLLGGDIHAAYVGVAEKTVETAFKEAIDNEPCIIFIDELENVCVNRNNPKAESHEKRLTVAFLEAYNLLKEKESNEPILFMGATNFPDQIDSAMLDRIELVAVPLPDEDARGSYFKRQLEGKLTLADDLTYDDMAEATENYSYRDLDRLVGNIKEYFKNLAIKQAKEAEALDEGDTRQIDESGKTALAEGALMMDYNTFEELRSQYKVSDKTEVRKALEAFEKRASE